MMEAHLAVAVTAGVLCLWPKSYLHGRCAALLGRTAMDGFGNPQATVPPGGRAPCEAAKGRQLEHHECGTHLRAKPAANGRCTARTSSAALPLPLCCNNGSTSYP